MTGSPKLEELIACLIQVIGRVAMPAESVREIVGRGKAHLKAFNMCDGTHKQQEIVAATGIDKGALSRLVRKWIESGIAFEFGSGKEARVLHIYPLVEEGNERTGAKSKCLSGIILIPMDRL